MLLVGRCTCMQQGDICVDRVQLDVRRVLPRQPRHRRTDASRRRRQQSAVLDRQELRTDCRAERHLIPAPTPSARGRPRQTASHRRP